METLEVIVMFFVMIETIQIFFLLRTNRQTKKLIEQVVKDPEYASIVAKNMVFGFMEDVTTDEEKAGYFINFAVWVGQNLIAGLKGTVAENVPKVNLPRSHWAKPFEDFIPGLIQTFANTTQAKGEEKVAEVVAGW